VVVVGILPEAVVDGDVAHTMMACICHVMSLNVLHLNKGVSFLTIVIANVMMASKVSQPPPPHHPAMSVLLINRAYPVQPLIHRNNRTQPPTMRHNNLGNAQTIVLSTTATTITTVPWLPSKLVLGTSVKYFKLMTLLTLVADTVLKLTHVQTQYVQALPIHHSGHIVDVTGFHADLGTLKGVPVARVATAFDSPLGDTPHFGC
jgi:hypothetical protein